ncbi:MAG: helix-turn-helix transcriptional regulator [Proteobacteria bacterium]|nr:helix-turn-helix transcriptional regulator [Pseudomonadota bacterium]
MSIKNIINRYLDKSGVSVAELAEKSGVPASTIYALRKAESCNLSTWHKLMAVIGPDAATPLWSGAADADDDAA